MAARNVQKYAQQTQEGDQDNEPSDGEQGEEDYLDGVAAPHVDEYVIQPPAKKQAMKRRKPVESMPSFRRPALAEGFIVVWVVNNGAKTQDCWVIPASRVTQAEEIQLIKLHGNDIDGDEPEAVMARALMYPIDMGVITEEERKRLVASHFTIGKWCQYRAQAGFLESARVNKIFIAHEYLD